MPRGATARLFAAVDPPAAISEQLAAWAREVSAALRGAAAPADGAKLRLLEPETMHVTLCFLGSRPVGEMDALAAALEQCEAPPAGELSLGAPLWLPPRNPRSLALEIGDSDGPARAPAACGGRGDRAGDLVGARPQALSRACDGRTDRARQAEQGGQAGQVRRAERAGREATRGTGGRSAGPVPAADAAAVVHAERGRVVPLVA